MTALDKALLRHTPEIHRSDQGVQYAANDYVKRLEDNDVKIRMRMAKVG